MPLHLFPRRELAAVGWALVKGRHVRRGRRWRGIEQVIEDPLSAQDRRCPSGVGGQHEDPPMSEQSASL